MDAVNLGERQLTELDFGRLNQLSLARGPAQLADLLDDAEVVEAPRAPPGLVTMYAQVEVEDLATQRRQHFVLCDPRHTEPRDGHISVLAPVGLALIGLRVGATASWHSPSGERCQARVLSVSGDPPAAA